MSTFDLKTRLTLTDLVDGKISGNEAVQAILQLHQKEVDQAYQDGMRYGWSLSGEGYNAEYWGEGNNDPIEEEIAQLTKNKKD